MEQSPALIPAIIVLALFLLSGILSLGAAIANWNWFFNSKNCRMLTAHLSRNQARFLYGIIGSLILLMTAIMAHDILSKAKPAHEPQPVQHTTAIYRDCKISTNDLGSTIFFTVKAAANNGAIS